MTCTVCNDVLPEPVPTGQRLARKCRRHYVQVNDIVLALHSDGMLPKVFTLERVRVTAVHGLNFSYKVDGSVDLPSFAGLCRLEDEGTWWARSLDDETAGALRAAHALAS